jgi:uncharacterized small protein (DUF1192 family)
MPRSSEKEIQMKKDDKTDSTAEEESRENDLELESVNDIIERIEGLSYEGRRHIIAYLKAKMDRSKKQRTQNQDKNAG